MQGFTRVFGVLELPVFVTVGTGFWQFSPMRTRRPAAEQLPADELFRSRLENQIDVRHPLVQLSHRLPWSALEQALSPRLPATTATGGRPGLPVRLIA
ncbi:transposase, partial [Xanthomonas oryzae]